MHILLHPAGAGEETDLAGAGSRGSLRAEDAPHPQGRGTSGSRRQHHLGCAREQKQLWSGLGFSDDLPRAVYKRTGFRTFPLERVYAAAKGAATAGAGLPSLNEIELTQERITYSHKTGPEACRNT